ncbi:hypothetical protein CUMW_230070 [Citrus unshiu]|uniref:Uncharacterized protein n=1 Tax=Citrus unshiu TaxID=55188 RepID=A0A2H5QH98_CITUN|nr:hypothetical protein CUMW_230070 [Citrus unshiu]
MEKELQKMDPKNGFRDIKLGGESPLFIDTLSKSWPSDRKHFRRSGLRHVISQQIVTPHQSMPHHQSMPPHRSVYVNSVVNSNVDSTVHVNSAIFSFMLLLRFSTVLNSKVMSVLPSDLSFIVK